MPEKIELRKLIICFTTSLKKFVAVNGSVLYQE